MKKELLKLAVDYRDSNVYHYACNSNGLAVFNKDNINEINDFMLKAIRKKESNLNREDLNDIIQSFIKQIKPGYGLHFDPDSQVFHSFKSEPTEMDYKLYDEMVTELVNSFDKNNIVDIKLTSSKENSFISEGRIEELKSIAGSDFDLKKLIRLCEELNIAYQNKCYYSVGFLVRVIKDHIPPIYGKKNFTEVASNVGNASQKKSLQHLENSLKYIADDMAHGHISKKEILPNEQTVSFKADLDVLIGLSIKELSK